MSSLLDKDHGGVCCVHSVQEHHQQQLDLPAARS